MEKICIVYTHHKLGDLIWQLPYIKAISQYHKKKIDLIVREKTQAKDILKDLNHIDEIYYNNFRKSIYYWIDVFKIFQIFSRIFKIGTPGRFHTMNVTVLVYRRSALQT